MLTKRNFILERLNEVVNNTNVDYETSQNSEDDVKQLEEFLKRSGLSSESSEGDNEDPEVKLRSYVRKFLALRMNKDVVKNIDMAESQKKTVSFALHERKRYSDEKVIFSFFTYTCIYYLYIKYILVF